MNLEVTPVKRKSLFQWYIRSLYPNVAKAGGPQSQGVKGEAVVVYREQHRHNGRVQ
jgi:hypothetical protein